MGLLAYGYWDLVAGEESSTEWMPHTRANWVRLASHKHDGVDSALIPSAYLSLSKSTQTIDSAAWIASGSGYKQTITMPGTLLFDSTLIKFKLSKALDAYDGAIIYPTVIKIAASQYDIYVNDNTIDVVAVYI